MDSVQPTIYTSVLIDKGFNRDDIAKYRFALQDADHVELAGQAEGRMEWFTVSGPNYVHANFSQYGAGVLTLTLTLTPTPTLTLTPTLARTLARTLTLALALTLTASRCRTRTTSS